MGLRHKLILTYATVALGAIVLAEGIGLGLMSLVGSATTGGDGTGRAPVGTVIAIGAIVGLLLGTWASQSSP
jgi:hypothetical protein